MTSYTKWDRDAYIERVGGPEEAERRRKALMARQSGQRLAEERKQRGLTQAQLAESMGVTPGRVSQIERGELSTIEAIARYVQALGGHLELVANFADHTLTVTTTEAACQQASGAPPQADQMARDRGLHQFSDSERVLARHNLYRRDIAALSSASGEQPRTAAPRYCDWSGWVTACSQGTAASIFGCHQACELRGPTACTPGNRSPFSRQRRRAAAESGAYPAVPSD
ncbi:MAG: helix-turn-helix domain-containing protein [Streptosporangiaceae bacterium]